jgi:hypothetical protein
MKKLSYLATGVLAALGFSSAAKADISVSGSTQMSVVADGTTNNWNQGGAVSFALSTTTAHGLGVAVGMGITRDTDAAAAAGAATGNNNVTFTAGGATIKVGVMGPTGDGFGDIGGLASDQTTVDGANGANGASAAMTTTTGTGVTLTTAVGGATLTIGYLFDTGTDTQADISAAIDNPSGVELSMPFGAYTVAIGYVTDGTDSDAGGTISGAAGAGTITVGYNTVDDSGVTETAMGATYAMSLDADTSLSFGYNQSKAAAGTTNRTDVVLSRSLGGGVSAYIEAANYSGVGTSGTDIGIGTKIAF